MTYYEDYFDNEYFDDNDDEDEEDDEFDYQYRQIRLQKYSLIFLFIFKKGVYKSGKMWYNIYIINKE